MESHWPRCDYVQYKFWQISSKFWRLCSFLFTILAQLGVNFTQVRLWFCFYLCDLFKVCLTLFNFVYILFWQLYTRKPSSILVQLGKSSHIYTLSHLWLHLTTFIEQDRIPKVTHCHARSSTATQNTEQNLFTPQYKRHAKQGQCDTTLKVYRYDDVSRCFLIWFYFV